MKKAFAVLFPFESPAWNSSMCIPEKHLFVSFRTDETVLATFYISSWVSLRRIGRYLES